MSITNINHTVYLYFAFDVSAPRDSKTCGRWTYFRVSANKWPYIREIKPLLEERN